MNNTCILIPALEPSYHFMDYVKALKQISHLYIVVVNDGWNQDYQVIFDTIDQIQL